jgi:3D (Asp-Asp-Asp) domain-containing protein
MTEQKSSKMKAKLTVISIGLSMLLFCINFKPIKTFKKLNRIRLNRPIKSEFIQMDRATTYNAVPSQCDSHPLTTADGSRIDPDKLQDGKIRWCALSRDFLARWGGLFDYGDTIQVGSFSSPQINGKWVVHDCMNARYSNSVDFLFDSENNKPKLGVCKDLVVKI